MKKHLLTGLSSLMLPMSIYALPSMLGSYQRSYLRAAIDSNNLRLSGRKHALRDAPRPEVSSSEPELLTGAPVKELVIVDAAVPDKHILYRAAEPGVDIVEIASTESGLAQLTEVLARYKNLSALHIVSHAVNGELLLGSSRITADNIKHEVEAFAALNGALRDGGDLLLYGCDLAAGQAGKELLEIIQSNTHLDLAASSNKTGSHDLTGDWELEISAGDIEAKLPFSDKALKDFSAILAAANGTYDFSGFTDAGNTLTSTDFIIGAKDSTGAPDLPVSIYGSVAFIDSGAVSVSNYFYVTADGVNTGSFELTGLAAAEYYTGEINFTNVRIVGILPDNSQITSAELDGSLATGDEDFIFGAGQLSNFAGVQLKAFKLYFDVTTRTAAGGGNGPFVGDASLFDFSSFTIANAQSPADTDGNVTAGAGVSEPVSLATSADNADDAVDVFDFTLVDGGTADGLAMTASQIVVNVAGTSTDAERSQITWRIDGPDVSNVTGTYNAGADTITFSGLSISVADGGNETYTINAYYNDITGLTNDHTIILGIDGDTDLTVGASGTQMGSTAAVSSGTGTTIETAGASLQFDGTNDTAVVADATFPDLSDSWTIEAWVNPDTLAEHNGIFSIADGGNDGIDLLILSGGRIEANATYGSNPITASGVVSTNTWQHIALVADPIHATDKLRLYVDGERVPFTDLDGFTGGTFSGDFYIGSREPGHGTPVWMDGNIDEVRVWNVARTEAEINASMSVETATQPKPASLVAYYSMNGLGQTVADESTAGTADAQRGTTAGSDAADPARSPDSPIFATNLTQSLAFTEGGASVALNDIVVSGPTGGTMTATLTVSNSSAGALSTGTFGSSTSTYNAGTGVWTVTGSIADVNAALAATAFAPATNHDQDVTIATRIRDAADTGPAIGTITLDVTAVNDAPTDIALSSSTILQSVTSAGADVGTLSSTDVDDSSFNYSLVSIGTAANGICTLAGGNSSFQINGTTLETGSALAPGSYSLCIQTHDGATSFERTRTVSVTDDVGPTISSVLVPADALYIAGQTLSFTVNTNENTTVDTSSGTPRIALTIGATARNATYTSGSGTSALIFQYTVQAGDNDADGIAVGALQPNSGTLRDATGNDMNLAFGPISTAGVLVDTAGPTAIIAVADTALAVGETSGVTITFSEAVSGFDNADLTVSNGTLSAVSSADGGITWTATLTPTAGATDTTNAITLANTGVTDAAGNAGTATTDSNNYAIDTARPTATIAVADTALSIGETSGVTITFSEAVTGFDNADLTVANGTLSAVSSADGGITWTATLTPSAGVNDASNVITLDNTGVTDAAANAGTGTTDSNNYSIDTDTATASLVVADTSLAAGETSLVTITFDEAVTGFDNADLTIGNATLSAVSSTDGGVTWTATLTPTADITDATNVVTLDNTGVTDAGGNTGTGTTDSNNYAIDTARPTATIAVADTALAAGETSAVTITFSEAVTGFTNADLTIGNGTLSAVSSADGGVTWTATLTPTADVTDTTNVITLDDTGVTDAAGNTGTGTTDSNNYAVDTTTATATIVVADTELNTGETSLVTITFSEAVTGFANDDLTFANGTLSAVSSSDGGITWTATFTPDPDVNAPVNVITLDNTGVDDTSGNAGVGTTDSNEFIIRTQALTLLVTTNLDSGDDATSAANLTDDETDGAGLSLREALSWSRPDDTITFDLDSVAAGNQGGTITLNGNALTVVHSNLLIDGDLDDDGAADVTISANDASRVMLINNNLSGIEITGLTLTEGTVATGGAGLSIGSNSSVTVRSSSITNSTETGLGGGGVYGASVSLTMIDSTVSGNSSSAFGGGIRIVGAGGTLNLINSTVSGNTTNGAGQHGGGIQYGGTGGLTIVNSTISGNTAAGATSLGGGLRITTGTAQVYNSTIVGNASTNIGGGVSANGTDTFVNTVIAGNTSGAGATAGTSGSPLATGGIADDVSGTIETATNSFFGTTAVITTDNGSLNNQGTGNLLLGDLADNGGQVLTHSPQPGSALIDSGSSAALPADAFDIDGDSDTAEILPRDARDNSRISATVEIGAVEVNDPPLATDDSAVTNEDLAVEIDVLANDSDSDGTLDASSVTIGTAPAHGTTLVNADGSITYTPALNWNGTDSFSYSVADNPGAYSNTATVSIAINAVNDLPVITGTPGAVVNSGSPYTFTPSLSDVDSTTLTVSAANLPDWATLNASTGAMTGTPGYDDAGTYSGIVLTVSDGIGTSSLPAFSIVVVGTTDLDGDGMSDVFEQTYGLDPTNPSDAGGDLDGDGISNLDEYLADRDPTADDYPPVLSSPAPITIDATGLLTPMPALTPPSAVDGRDGALTAALADNRSHLEPGTHILTWYATDAAGNRGETLQALNVRPLISLARDQVVAEGTTAQVRVILNGFSPSYPLGVAYTVGGSAGTDDHDLAAGAVVFQQGELEKTVAVQIAPDGMVEGEETIEVALSGEGNFGVQRTHIIRIVEANLAPTLQWSVMQDGRSVRIAMQDQGPVTLTAIVRDANAGDSHTYEWRMPAGVTATSVGDAVRIFDPSIVAPGVYRVELTVSDDGTPAQSTRSAQLFQVIASAPALSDSADSDDDGIDDAAEGLTDQDGDGQPDYLDANTSPNVLNESAGDGGLFLIEADPGVSLSLGDRAMTHGADGAQLSSGELVAQGDIGPDSIANVGGYFDLTIRDLPEVGASVNVVIPQRQAIPQHPLYRKFLNGQWTTFAENAANRLASAPGTLGVCPPPGSNEYRPGLNPGDWCVRLTLEDGGPNDADSIANGAVEDPGGVGAVPNVTSSTRGGGGGAMGTPLLMLLLIMALHRMRCLKVKYVSATAMALALAAIIPAQAEAEHRADSHGLYVTGTFGYADTQISTSDVQRDFAAQEIDSTVHSVDGDRLAWGVGVGYPLADRWAVEAGYLDLGEVDLRFDTVATETNLAHVHPVSARGATLSGLHRLRLGDRVTARARLGAFIWRSEYTTRRADEQIDANDDSGIDLLWGLSLGYDLSSAWTLNLELQRIELDDEPTDIVGLQAQWRIRPRPGG